MKEVTLKVEGMSCGHCKMAVEKAVKDLDGVGEAVVDLTAKTVKVSFSEDNVNEASIKEAIEEQGYDVV